MQAKDEKLKVKEEPTTEATAAQEKLVEEVDEDDKEEEEQLDEQETVEHRDSASQTEALLKVGAGTSLSVSLDVMDRKLDQMISHLSHSTIVASLLC